jgi:hypothetical protein
MFGRRKKCALLIDFDNVLGMTSGEFTTSIAKWMEWLEDGAFDEKRQKRKFLIKRVYWILYDRYPRPARGRWLRGVCLRCHRQEQKSSADMVSLDAVDIAAGTRGWKKYLTPRTRISCRS